MSNLTSILSLNLLTLIPTPALHLPHHLRLVQPLRHVGAVILDAVVLAARRNEDVEVPGQSEAEEDGDDDDVR